MHSKTLQFIIDSICHQRYIVFPTDDIYRFWCRQLSKHTEVISLEYCLDISSVFDIFSHKYLSYFDITKHSTTYFISRKERHILLSMILQQKEIQKMLITLEQIDITSSNVVFDEFAQSYISKFEVLLQAYHLITQTCNDNDFFLHCINTFYQSYLEILHKSNCIDTLVLPTLLVQNNICIDDTFILLYPQLLSNELQASFFYLDKNRTVNISCFFEDISKKQENDNTVSTNIHKNNSTENVQYNVSEYIEYMQKLNVPAYSNTSIKKFIHTQQELSYVCKSIREKLNSVEAHTIAIVLCDKNQTIIEDLQSTAKSYDIPLQNISMSQQFSLLECIWKLYSKGYTVNVLQDLFMDPCIPWKQRAMHIRIIQLGYKKVPRDNINLTLWRKILAREVIKEHHSNTNKQQEHSIAKDNVIDISSFHNIIESEEKQNLHTEVSQLNIYEYFFSFHNMLQNIVKASSFVELKELIQAFISIYMNVENIQDIPWLKKLYETLDDYVIFSRHMNVISSFEKQLTKSPFHILCSMLTQYSISNTSYAQSAVALCIFPHSLYCEYQYQYYIGFNQNALTKVLVNPVLFHEILNNYYISDILQKRYEKRNQYIQYSLDYYADTIDISFSAKCSDGIQPDPSFWNNIEPTFIVDNFQEEQKYWMQLCNDAHTKDNNDKIELNTENFLYTVSSMQNKGLEYQQNIQSNTQNASFFTQAIDTKICQKYQKSIQRDGSKKYLIHTYIHPSNLSLIVENPLIYLLTDVLQLQELFPRNDFLYSERMVFSSLIHETFAHMATILTKYIQKQNAVGTICSDSQMDMLLALVPHIVVDGKDIFMRQLANEPLYFFMQQSIENAFDEVLLYHFMSVLLYSLYTQQLSIYTIEERLEMDLSEIDCNYKKLPPFILQGKPDLCFYHHEEEYYSLFDYKLRKDTNSQVLIRYFTQLWAYHVLVAKNTHFFLQNDMKGSLYYIADSYKNFLLHNTVFPLNQSLNKDTSLEMLDYIEQKLKQYNTNISVSITPENTPASRTISAIKKRTDKIYNFLSTIEDSLYHSLSSLYQLNFFPESDLVTSHHNSDNTEQDDDSNVKNKEDSMIQNFISSLILREQCFIYRNRD